MEKSYGHGIIGALIGALIATIPWIVLYVYANLMLSVVTVFIALGALKGYQILNGKIDKKLPIIISVISFIAISVATLLIIPGLLIVKEGASFSYANIKILYADSNFLTAILRDYFISIVFTFLGISGVISSLKKQTSLGGNIQKIDLSAGNNKKDKEKVKNYFISRNAVTKERGIILSDDNELNLETINLLEKQNIIIKVEDKYYYDLKTEQKTNKKNKIAIVISVIFISAILVLSIILNTDEVSNKVSNTNQTQETKKTKDFNYEVPSGYIMYDDEENENSYFYIPKEDLSGYSGYINVYYIQNDSVYSENWVKDVENNFLSYEDIIDMEKPEYFQNNSALDVVKFKLTFNEYTDTIYYIFGDSKLGIIEVIDYGKKASIQDDGLIFVNDFTWETVNTL